MQSSRSVSIRLSKTLSQKMKPFPVHALTHTHVLRPAPPSIAVAITFHACQSLTRKIA